MAVDNQSLFVMGGQQRQLRPLSAGNNVWQGYGKGLIVKVQPATGKGEVVVSYVSPPEVCEPGEAEILFQSGTVADGRLYACTGTEVIIYSLPDFSQEGYLSLPCFNDVHHVRPRGDSSLLIANAGLDMVLDVTISGEINQIWNVLDEDPWSRFQRNVDYRRIGSTKPHRGHPNHVFCLGDEIWATRFQQGDAVCLTDKKRMQVSQQRIHDGVVRGDHVYFTSVNGNVIVVHGRTLKIEEVVDLNSMHEGDTALGWCRGILLEGERLWVGYSRIRPTRARENVAWLMRGFRQVKGTHVACYDLQSRTCVVDVDLEPIGLNAVFSIFRSPSA